MYPHNDIGSTKVIADLADGVAGVTRTGITAERGMRLCILTAFHWRAVFLKWPEFLCQVQQLEKASHVAAIGCFENWRMLEIPCSGCTCGCTCD